MRLGQEEIDAVAVLAHEIWNQHFPSIIGQEQVDYMLAELQSASAISRQIRENGYEYYLVADEEARVGYFALVADDGVITHLFVEEGGDFKVSSAEHVLGAL